MMVRYHWLPWPGGRAGGGVNTYSMCTQHTAIVRTLQFPTKDSSMLLTHMLLGYKINHLHLPPEYQLFTQLTSEYCGGIVARYLAS